MSYILHITTIYVFMIKSKYFGELNNIKNSLNCGSAKKK